MHTDFAESVSVLLGHMGTKITQRYSSSPGEPGRNKLEADARRSWAQASTRDVTQAAFYLGLFQYPANWIDHKQSNRGGTFKPK